MSKQMRSNAATNAALSPFRRVVSLGSTGTLPTERLECGHVLAYFREKPPAERRRCWKCRLGRPADDPTGRDDGGAG